MNENIEFELLSGRGTPIENMGLEPEVLNGGLNDYHNVPRARIDACR